MGVERRKVIWVRMLSFSPWCRHVPDSLVWVSPSLGLAALTNKASPFVEWVGTLPLADYPATFDSCWENLPALILKASTSQIILPFFKKDLCCLCLFRQVECGFRWPNTLWSRLTYKKKKGKKKRPWEIRFSDRWSIIRSRILRFWDLSSSVCGLHTLFPVFSVGSFSEAGVVGLEF